MIKHSAPGGATAQAHRPQAGDLQPKYPVVSGVVKRTKDHGPPSTPTSAANLQEPNTPNRMERDKLWCRRRNPGSVPLDKLRTW